MIRHQRVRANEWRSRAGSPTLPLGEPWLATRRGLVLYHWRARRVRARAYYAGIWRWYYASGASCVHTLEGSWTDPNAPGYGGFQMYLAFQEAHGARYLRRWGTADHWPATVQIRVTRSVVEANGWGQWPNTARMCGLLG